jgi:hypothetical protein
MMKKEQSMRRDRLDFATYIAAIIVPVITWTTAIALNRQATTEAQRDLISTASIIILLAWWLFLMAWAIVRLVLGIRRRWGGLGGRIAALVLVFFMSPIGIAQMMIYMPLHIIMKVRPDRHRLQYTLDHTAIAEACAQVMSNHGAYTNLGWDAEEFPPILRDIRPSYISVNESGIVIEMHGGFDHYGFRFRPDDSGIWSLFYYTERSSTQLVSGVIVNRGNLQQ